MNYFLVAKFIINPEKLKYCIQKLLDFGKLLGLV